MTQLARDATGHRRLGEVRDILGRGSPLLRDPRDMIHRVATLFPKNFVPVCQLPQTPGSSPANCRVELERCVKELGFVGCNVNPDPTGGF